MIRCSHIVCKVNDLTRVVRDYESLGFSIEWGSEPGRANNALLWFEKGPFIEFFTPPVNLNRVYKFFAGLYFGKALKDRVIQYMSQPEGWCDVAFESTGYDEYVVDKDNNNLRLLKQIKSTFHERNIPVSRVIKGSRIRPDKKKVTYQLIMPGLQGFPFITAGYNFPQRPAAIRHPNGVTGIRSVRMAVDKTDMENFTSIYGNDRLVNIRQAATTRLLDIGLAGQNMEMNPKLLHGARFS